MAAVEAAFRRARKNSVQHMAACERAQLRWGETAISEIVMSRAAAAVSVVPFTQHAEAVSGADLVWWWVDSTSAYGMLVQAKRLTIDEGRWRFDFSYRSGRGIQRTNLMATAASLDLIPVYALYLGSGDYRHWEPCPDDHQRKRCQSCLKRSVSLMPALLADPVFVNDSNITYARSVALEDSWTPTTVRQLLFGTLSQQVDPELANFLLNPQTGSRAVTRAMIDRVLTVRAGQFAAFSASVPSMMRDGDHDQLGPVFPDLPSDTGHWGIPYFKHVLDPLRHVPPDYVLQIESREFDVDELASTMPLDVAGVVVVRLPRNG